MHDRMTAPMVPSRLETSTLCTQYNVPYDLYSDTLTLLQEEEAGSADAMEPLPVRIVEKRPATLFSCW